MASNKIFIYQDDKENGILTKKVEAKSGVFGNENRTKLATITNVRKNDENALVRSKLFGAFFSGFFAIYLVFSGPQESQAENWKCCSVPGQKLEYTE